VDVDEGTDCEEETCWTGEELGCDIARDSDGSMGGGVAGVFRLHGCVV
jgi:hypothetical protein